MTSVPFGHLLAYISVPQSKRNRACCRAMPRGSYTFLAQVITGTAEVHGCKAEVRWSEQAYGATVNAPEMVGLVEGAAKQLVGASRWQRLPEPTMAAEDFSFLAGVHPPPLITWKLAVLDDVVQ